MKRGAGLVWDQGRGGREFELRCNAIADTGWRRLIGFPKLQIIFRVHKRATKSRSLLRKITYKDKGSYESSPPCIVQPLDSPLFCLLCPQVDIPMNFFPGRWVQCVDVCCSVLPWERECRDVLHCFAVCSVLQCVAVSCSVLQCVAVYCCRPRRSPRRGWSTVRSVL